MKQAHGFELCFIVVSIEAVVFAESLAAFVHERGRVVAQIKVIGIGRNIFQVSPTFPIARLLDRSFDLSQKSFVVGHRTAPSEECGNHFQLRRLPFGTAFAIVA